MSEEALESILVEVLFGIWKPKADLPAVLRASVAHDLEARKREGAGWISSLVFEADTIFQLAFVEDLLFQQNKLQFGIMVALDARLAQLIEREQTGRETR
jgi:hypothetical protein